MKKYSKLIGMVVGLAVGAAVNAGLLSAGVDVAGLSEAILTILTGIGVYAPTNAT